MVLKQIITRNIQNHKEIVIDLPPTGLVLFAGENSNGKSVIVRTTRDLLQNNIKKPRCRAELVNRKATFGEITYVREDDVTLTLHITREAAGTYVVLQSPGAEDVVRYLSDRNYIELVRMFGWNVCEDTGVSLNIAEGDEALLFYKTPNKINGKVLQSANTDPIAEQSLLQLETTLSDARKFKDNAVAQTRIISSTLSGLEIHDIDALNTRKEKLEYYYRNLSAVYLPTLPVVKPVPKVRINPYYVPRLPKIKYPRVVSVKCAIPDITQLAQEIATLKEHKCPMCGRGFDCAC